LWCCCMCMSEYIHVRVCRWSVDGWFVLCVCMCVGLVIGWVIENEEHGAVAGVLLWWWWCWMEGGCCWWVNSFVFF
jgi:hypothetical protein